MKRLFLVGLMLPSLCFAWGKRGHQIVGETAAMLASTEKDAGWLKSRSFDFGYYSNVPDFIWKRPATYQKEKNQHFMDLEIFERTMPKDPGGTDPFSLSRAEFDTKYPNTKEEAGRAFWRIREMVEKLEQHTKALRALEVGAPVKERHALQEKWMVVAGTLGHYVGDLAMPLHVSENYDGQLTNQKGIHSYFEEDLVDELYPGLAAAVHSQAKSQWPAFKKRNSGKSLLELLHQITKSSEKQVKPLLAIDKANKRDVSIRGAEKFRKMIEQRLVEGTLTLAEIYRRQLGWKFNGDKFYFFAGEPEFIPPGAN